MNELVIYLFIILLFLYSVFQAYYLKQIVIFDQTSKVVKILLGLFVVGILVMTITLAESFTDYLFSLVGLSTILLLAFTSGLTQDGLVFRNNTARMGLFKVSKVSFRQIKEWTMYEQKTRLKCSLIITKSSQTGTAINVFFDKDKKDEIIALIEKHHVSVKVEVDK